MNLIEALEISRKPVAQDAKLLRVFLACGFTPLHLQNFLSAHLRQQFPDNRVEIKTGLFGDLVGSLERIDAKTLDGLTVAMEWSDLDSRLGIRELGGWQVSDVHEVISSVDRQLSRLQRAIKMAARSAPVVVSLPTLALPPLFYTPPNINSAEKTKLLLSLAKFAADLAEEPGIRVLDSQALDSLSPPAARFDIKSEILSGFPYKLPHASTLAQSLASLLQPRSPKKGLITDLDDTLWSGILGEVGVDGVNWSLEHHSHIHGLYQQFLSSLASAGVLVGVASKNDAALVQQAFDRKDLLLKKDKVFPFEVHWHCKSDSVQRILKSWNIGPEAVVFIDDSPMEAAEVKAAFPAMECLVFKKDDYQSVWDLLANLRASFGKTAISKEDAIRLESLRSTAPLLDALGRDGNASDEFLKRADAFVSFDFTKRPKDGRAFELVNKTNQFNLNGKRFSESEWTKYLADPASFLVTVTYQDKYGPLGKIAVLLGKVHKKKLHISAWVMSCRAFSRRIEHHSLKRLFDKFDADEAVFDFQSTERNGPTQDFFLELVGDPPQPGLKISRASFQEKAPPLFHRVEEM
ncbi:MAG TPA: HAD-IIIC family phosphatase [Candidatus Acidoferrum sp.]|nr:HAD-IIIC family phosphatase [Candidatus Acidoferrum sp.]